MKLSRIALLIAAVAIPIIGQQAKILIVEKSDSARLAKAYREYKDAMKHWEDVKADVAKSYTVQDGKQMEGWDKIQFSADFRAIVPETSRYASSGYGCTTTGTLHLNGGGGNVWTVPAGVHSNASLTDGGGTISNSAAGIPDPTTAGTLSVPVSKKITHADDVRPDLVVKEKK